jgi:hypothetical protein
VTVSTCLIPSGAAPWNCWRGQPRAALQRLVARGFADAVIAGLVDTGLVAATTKRVLAGQRTVDVTSFNITDRGRQTLATAARR